MNRRSLGTLAARDFRQLRLLVAIYCAIIAGVLVSATAGEGSLAEDLSGLFLLPGVLALLAVVPFVQTIVWKEKAAGTFLLLRMLPLTDDEILFSKLVVVTAAGSFILLVPALALAAAAMAAGGGLPAQAGWMLLWEWVGLAVMTGWSTASAIVFTQQWAAVVPYLALLAASMPFIAAGYALGPSFWAAIVRWHAPQWGLVPASLLAWHGWRLSLRLFHNRDFAQLVE
ncbi:MAG TPA: hypothetical protein VGS20_00965 [Candidatus Acidoferrales bacterium]|nr:hypothetical protein [Candidatus Acidoferrales bacterium]